MITMVSLNIMTGLNRSLRFFVFDHGTREGHAKDTSGPNCMLDLSICPKPYSWQGILTRYNTRNVVVTSEFDDGNEELVTIQIGYPSRRLDEGLIKNHFSTPIGGKRVSIQCKCVLQLPMRVTIQWFVQNEVFDSVDWTIA